MRTTIWQVASRLRGLKITKELKKENKRLIIMLIVFFVIIIVSILFL
jgi:hypothetical protein